MATFIGLLRGINVGGRHKIKMAELKERMAKVGLNDVTTYIQSGNMVFDSAKTFGELEKLIATTIDKHFGFEVPVFVRGVPFFRNVFDNNPFLGDKTEWLYVTLLSNSADPKIVKKLRMGEYGSDKHSFNRDVVYLSCQNGYSQTKLTNGFFEKKLKVTATTRNWKTITRLLELAET